MKPLSFYMTKLSAGIILLLTCSLDCVAADYYVNDFGAAGDGHIDDAASIQLAIDSCSRAGGGSVVFLSGQTYLSGPIHLKSNVDLHFQPNSVLLANPDETIYTESAFRANRGEGCGFRVITCIIFQSQAPDGLMATALRSWVENLMIHTN